MDFKRVLKNGIWARDLCDTGAALLQAKLQYVSGSINVTKVKFSSQPSSKLRSLYTTKQTKAIDSLWTGFMKVLNFIHVQLFCDLYSFLSEQSYHN